MLYKHDILDKFFNFFEDFFEHSNIKELVYEFINIEQFELSLLRKKLALEDIPKKKWKRNKKINDNISSYFNKKKKKNYNDFALLLLVFDIDFDLFFGDNDLVDFNLFLFTLFILFTFKVNSFDLDFDFDFALNVKFLA